MNHNQVEALEQLKRSFANAPISKFFGQELTSCGDGRAEVRLPFRSEFENGLNIIHGGIITAIADTAGYFAAASLVSNGIVTTVELKLNMVAAARKEALIARSEVLSRGKSILVCQFKVTGEKDQLIAVGQGTFYIQRPTAASPSPQST